MSAIIKLKALTSHLQELDGFTTPKIELEQYETPAHIAAVALYTIQTQFGDLQNKSVLDAGCGPGMLGIGASLLGAGAVTALEYDGDALETCKSNVDNMAVTNIDLIQCDFLKSHHQRWADHFDTVLMNPPFGTKNNAGIDMKFLQTALLLTSDSVYSLHKSTTRRHIQKKITEWGVKGSVIAELKYNLEASYKFHQKQSRDIAVDLWRVHKN